MQCEVYMAHELNYLAVLQEAVQNAQKCAAVHFETVPVRETIDGRIIWQGNVEVFNLTGHGQAKRCYAWLHTEDGQHLQFITILETAVVNSPQKAVQSAIFFDAQPAQYPQQVFLALMNPEPPQDASA
jgi:hypothetical protein